MSDVEAEKARLQAEADAAAILTFERWLAADRFARARMRERAHDQIERGRELAAKKDK